MNSFDVHLQTHNHTYGYPKPNPAKHDETQPLTSNPLQIPCHSSNNTPHVPKVHLHCTTNNPHVRVDHGYSIVDDLAQSLAAMSSLEVLQTYYEGPLCRRKNCYILPMVFFALRGGPFQDQVPEEASSGFALDKTRLICAYE